MMNTAELTKFEARWKRVFAVAAGIFVLCLLDLVTFSARGAEGVFCYSVGSIAALAGLYAAKKLRDPERVDVIVDGQWLSANSHPGLPEHIDVDD